jgi:hypothetical protein
VEGQDAAADDNDDDSDDEDDYDDDNYSRSSTNQCYMLCSLENTIKIGK